MITVHEEHAKIFKAFCDEKRLSILELLRSGEKCACVLIEQLDIPQSSLSYHMKILCESGIVYSRPEGKWTYYKISKKGFDEAMELLKAIITPNAMTEESNCPVGAITYVGDDTGWAPPNGELPEEESCCSCGCGADTEKKISVEYLYLDLETCDRCIGTDNVLDEVMMTITPALKIAGFEVEYNKIEMKTAEIATQYKFLSSPTIRVNGQDICQSVAENSCGCCSDISGTDVSCRVFEYNEETYEVPPKEMLAESILNAVFGQHETGCSCCEYELPENLREFFEGKKSKSGCSCGGNC